MKLGNDESHFNVSLIVRDKVTRPCPQATTFEEKVEPKRYRTEVLPFPAYRLTARPNRPSIGQQFHHGPVNPGLPAARYARETSYST